MNPQAERERKESVLRRLAHTKKKGGNRAELSGPWLEYRRMYYAISTFEAIW